MRLRCKIANIRSKSHYDGFVNTPYEYWYDPSQRLTNIVNLATNATVTGLGYDVQGNLANKNGQTYRFDYGNRLREVPNKESYRYDAHGRRVQSSHANGARTLFQYTQAGQLVYRHDEAASLAIDQIYLGGSLVAMRERNVVSGVTATRYQHTDPLGSPVAITGQAGQVLDRNNYEPYGAVLSKPAYNGMGFAGHPMDGATGMSYMQQRYYDPVIGRFLSMDPVTADTVTGGNFNRYWYANNNPYTIVDPDGRKGVAWIVKLTATGMKKLARISQEQAVRARRQGENILADRRQAANQIERAAHPDGEQLKHAAHELKDGSKGLPHYQTEGVSGHAFWGTVSVAALATAGALDQFAEKADAFDPTSAMTNISDAGRPGVTHECQQGCTPFVDNRPKPEEKPEEDHRDDPNLPRKEQL